MLTQSQEEGREKLINYSKLVPELLFTVTIKYVQNLYKRLKFKKYPKIGTYY